MLRYLFVLILASTPALVQAAAIVPSPPQAAATAYLLVDADSGAVLAEHNADEQLPPASLTKMMTSYLLAREIAEGRVSESDRVTVSENAWSQNPIFKGSSLMWIEPGKDVTIGELQRGIIISSGNDATVAVAEHIAGSEDVFVELMNATAAKLGMHDTYYVNSHGLPHPDHLTTARDLVTLSVAMIRDYPEQYAIYAEKEFTYNDIRQYNRNRLIFEDPSVDGIKTGHTQEAGYCLVASAERDGMRLVSVVMGTASERSRKNETRSLLNYGFRFFETTTMFEPGEELASPRVWQGEIDHVPAGLLDAAVLTLPRGRSDELETSVQADQDPIAPLATGDRLGTVTLSLDGETVFEAPLVALAPVERGGFFARLWDMFLMWFAALFRT